MKAKAKVGEATISANCEQMMEQFKILAKEEINGLSKQFLVAKT